MIKLEDYSRKELIKLAGEKGATDYHNLSKSELIKLLLSKEDSVKVKVDEITNKVEQALEIPEKRIKKAKVKAALSAKALQWKTYLNRIKITPEEFLRFYSEHPERKYIEELIET